MKGFIVAGLGNPGTQYEHNRHNIGFMFVDYLVSKHELRWSGSSKWNGSICRSSLWGEAVCLVKPFLFMNRSGQTIAAVAAFYNISPDNILVVHDDLD
ncbi:MAG: aminoacyl-tRNA hydrolase, partial [Desulfocapsaceae bacterium]|nr:aminoacyl-tRNA hydrolase [Desulfocapsaceae bacterium]